MLYDALLVDVCFQLTLSLSLVVLMLMLGIVNNFMTWVYQVKGEKNTKKKAAALHESFSIKSRDVKSEKKLFKRLNFFHAWEEM